MTIGSYTIGGADRQMAASCDGRPLADKPRGGVWLWKRSLEQVEL
jgi:hypothetical protein